jgi:hypothetical protein
MWRLGVNQGRAPEGIVTADAGEETQAGSDGNGIFVLGSVGEMPPPGRRGSVPGDDGFCRRGKSCRMVELTAASPNHGEIIMVVA